MHLVEEVKGGVLELIGLLLELLRGDLTLTRLGLRDDLTESSDLLADLVSLGLVKTVGELVKSLLGIVHDRIGAVSGLNGSLALLISLSVLLRVVDHVLDLLVGETGAGSKGDRLVLAGGLVLGVNVDDGISIDVEGDLDLWNTAVRWWDTNKLEVSEQLVVADELTLSLVDLDLDSSLIISGGGEDLGLLGWDGGVAVDETGEDTSEGLNTEGEWGNIKEKDIHDLTSEDGTLDSGTDGDGLIRVNRLGWVTAEDGADRLGDLWHTGHTSDEDNLLDILGGEVGVLESLADWLNSATDEWVNKLLELSTGKLHVDVLWSGSISSDERKVDIGLHGRRQLNLGLLGGLTDTLDGHAISGKVETGGFLEVGNDVADESDIEILSSQVGVTVGGLDLKNTLLDLENGDIKGSSTEIVDSDDLILLLLKTVRKGSGSWLVDDTENVQSGDLTSILGGLTLGVVEVSWDGDNGVLDWLVEVGLSGLLHLVEDESSDLGWRVLLATGGNPGISVGVLDDLEWNLLDVALDLNIGELASDETLGSEKGVLWVDDGLTLGGNTDKTLTILGESDDGWGGTGTLGVLNDAWDLSLHYGDSGVGGSYRIC